MNILKALGFAVLMAVSGTVSQAAVIYATDVISFDVGTNTVPGGEIAPERSVLANALGPTDGKFLSLGLGGELVVKFAKRFTGPASIFEVTGGSRLGHKEAIQLYGGLNGVFTFLGTLTNAVGFNNLNFTGVFNQLKLIDISPTAENRDGFDVDSIAVSAIPVPAAGLLLISALGLVAMVRRRKA